MKIIVSLHSLCLCSDIYVFYEYLYVTMYVCIYACIIINVRTYITKECIVMDMHLNFTFKWALHVLA